MVHRERRLSGNVPLIIALPENPVGWVLFLHGAGGSKERTARLAAPFHEQNLATVHPDAPLHGERAEKRWRFDPKDLPNYLEGVVLAISAQVAELPELAGRLRRLPELDDLPLNPKRVANAFDMKVIAWSQHLTPERAAECQATYVKKDSLFNESDIVSIHVRLSDRTKGLVGARELALMKPTSYLVNISRGPIVDEGALIDVLKRRAIAGAALDTFDVEPLPVGHPFLSLSNTIIAPHNGYVTQESYEAFYGGVLEDIRAFASGEAIRVVNPDVLTSPQFRGMGE